MRYQGAYPSINATYLFSISSNSYLGLDFLDVRGSGTFQIASHYFTTTENSGDSPFEWPHSLVFEYVVGRHRITYLPYFIHLGKSLNMWLGGETFVHH